jgi:hypothetical protein
MFRVLSHGRNSTSEIPILKIGISGKFDGTDPFPLNDLAENSAAEEGHAFTRAVKSHAEGVSALPKAGVKA